MILTEIVRQPITTEDGWEDLFDEIKQSVDVQSIDPDIVYSVANTYSLPLHIAYLILHSIKTGKEFELSELASVSYYAICRDILTTYKNKSYTFRRLFKLGYPYLKNTDERLEWFLKHDNGLTLKQKIGILEADTSLTKMGIGRIRFEKAIQQFNIEATHDEVERRRLEETDWEWPAAVASFSDKERGDITAAELLKVGDALAEESSGKIKVAVFSSLLQRMGKIEIYFLAAQINRFHDNISRTSSLIRAFSKAFNVERDMLERLVSMHSMVDVAELVQEGKILTQFEKIVPFRPFRPMLAEKWEKQYKFPCFAEAKYDGVRLLIHKLGNRISCYARRRRDYTYKFPIVTQLANRIPAYSIILDGEITAQQWTMEGPRYLNVYELHESVKHGMSGIVPIYVMFDVLFMNGVEIYKLPYKQRRQIRHQLFKAISSSGQITGLQLREVQTVEVFNQEQLIKTYNNFIDTKHEGAIVKDPNGAYELGKRSKHWLKLKPKETIDVTITGVVPMQQQGTLRIAGFRYAVIRDDEYVNLGMIYGLEAQAGIKIAELLLSNGLIPENGQLVNLSDDIESRGKFTRVKRSMGFEVEPSIVVTIDSLGIVRQQDKFSLRNARFLHIREDMPVDDISNWYEIFNNYMKANT